MSSESQSHCTRKSLIHSKQLLEYIFRHVTHKTPGYFFALYLLLIPAFGSLFFLIRNDFYHATAQYEPFLQDQSDVILDGLTGVLVEELNRKWPTGQAKHDDLLLAPTGLRAASLRINDDSVKFNLWLTPTRDGNNAGAFWPVKVSFDAMPIFSTVSDDSRDIVAARLEEMPADRPKDSVPPFPVEAAFHMHEGWSGGKYTVLKLPHSLGQKILAYNMATKGKPAYIPGGIVRMFYLSAMTATTVGYGDIVPLTTRARGLVAFEAVFGIVLIGLALNAVGRETTGRLKTRKNPKDS